MCSMHVHVCVCVCVYFGCMSGGCAESETEKEKTSTALTLRDLPLVGEHLANMTSWTSHLPFPWLKSSVVTSSQWHLSPCLLKAGLPKRCTDNDHLHFVYETATS